MAPALILIANEMTILIIVILALVLFGGSRIAGVGKGAGRAIREFKEETSTLKGEDAKKAKGGADAGDAKAVEAKADEKSEAKPSE